mgnify:FL=1
MSVISAISLISSVFMMLIIRSIISTSKKISEEKDKTIEIHTRSIAMLESSNMDLTKLLSKAKLDLQDSRSEIRYLKIMLDRENERSSSLNRKLRDNIKPTLKLKRITR